MDRIETQFLREHRELTRRFFLKSGTLGLAGATWPAVASSRDPSPIPQKTSKPPKAGARPEPYFTPASDFRDVSRGKPLPHSLSDETKRRVGLTRETWQLEILSDPDHPASLERQFLKSDGTAFDFEALLNLGKKHAVRFPKVMTCLNLGCPLGMGLWEGVPLRELIWLTKPRENLRRVFYHGYHNEDPKQIFRSSMPIGRILEDTFDLPPVIMCYKLNGKWLDSERGGPVRIVVPEHYGFKSVKWLTHLFLTNLDHANDTYAEQNNDVDSPLKTFAATLSIAKEVDANVPIPVSGYAQVGISGLSRVQVSIESNTHPWPETDPYFTKANWIEAEILQHPKVWGDLEQGKIPENTLGFDKSGEPKSWPLRLCNAHWAILLPGLASGNYTFRCRTIDEKGNSQPMPRPFRKSGHASIEAIEIVVK